jgi:hypothetical protein
MCAESSRFTAIRRFSKPSRTSLYKTWRAPALALARPFLASSTCGMIFRYCAIVAGEVRSLGADGRP